MLNDKKPEELDERNQKGLQNISGKFLYYYIAIVPKILMALNSLAVVHTKPTRETEKNNTVHELQCDTYRHGSRL